MRNTPEEPHRIRGFAEFKSSQHIHCISTNKYVVYMCMYMCACVCVCSSRVYYSHSLHSLMDALEYVVIYTFAATRPCRPGYTQWAQRYGGRHL